MQHPHHAKVSLSVALTRARNLVLSPPSPLFCPSPPLCVYALSVCTPDVYASSQYVCISDTPASHKVNSPHSPHTQRNTRTRRASIMQEHSPHTTQIYTTHKRNTQHTTHARHTATHTRTGRAKVLQELLVSRINHQRRSARFSRGGPLQGLPQL
jgi:hypothetical protein